MVPRNPRLTLRAVALAGLAFFATAASPAPGNDGPGVYLKLVDSSALPFDQVASTLTQAIKGHGWNVAGQMDVAVDPEKCSYRGRVIVAWSGTEANRVLGAGNHAAFAVPVRFVVWEDENGVSIGVTNPMNLYRTIVDEETAPEDWADLAGELRGIAAAAFPGTATELDYGQHRDKSRIGKTMGVVAGGKFIEKIETVTELPDAKESPAAVARTLFDGIEAGDAEWGIHPVYVIDFPERGLSILGVSGAKMEYQSANIVNNGHDDARKNMACPGIDHMAAYPVEVLIEKTDAGLRISLVDEMYRMKMFFENAGRMAFMKNMGMPGSIEDEIRNKIEGALAAGTR